MVKKLVYVGTHPNQTNGYSKVIYNHLKYLGENSKHKVICYGIQNQFNNKRELNFDNIKIYDAALNEKTNQYGFAYNEFQEFIELCTPDIILIFNDPVVSVNYLKQIEYYNCEKWCYLDLVYNNVNTQPIEYIYSQCQKVFHMNDFINSEYSNVKNRTLNHGIELPKTKLSKQEICNNLNIDIADIFILNLNRNTPRKRYDIFIEAIVLLFKQIEDKKVKVILGTNVSETFNLSQLFQIFANRHNLNVKWKDIFIVFDKPNTFDDQFIENIYQLCDIGTNCCDGEGWGLCNFEHMIFEKPQVLTDLPSFRTYCDENNSILIPPITSYFIDSTRDLIGGEGKLIKAQDFANGLAKYVYDEELRNKHGKLAKESVEKFTWDKPGKQLLDLIEQDFDTLD